MALEEDRGKLDGQSMSLRAIAWVPYLLQSHSP